jgi:sec-independent protein translocase protein TatB
MEMVVIAAVGLVVVGPERLPEMVRGAAGFYRELRQAFIKAQSTVKAEMALLERELNQAAEPEKTGPPIQAPEAPREDKADGRA